jgi:hypothetical protein
MITLILAYFFVNSFFAGWMTAGRAAYYNVILALLFGVFFLIYTVLAVLLVDIIWKNVNKYFQLQFFWDYHFRNSFSKMKVHDIKKLNDFCRKSKSTNRQNHIIYRYCISLINRRNNYENGVN